MKRYDFFGGILLLIVGGIVCVDGLTLGIIPVGSGTLPVLTSLILGATAIYLITGIFRKDLGDQAPSWPTGKGLFNLLYVVGAMALYLVALGYAGFVISTFFFTVGVLYKLSPYKWYKLIILGILISVGSCLMFQKLGLPLPSWYFERYMT